MDSSGTPFFPIYFTYRPPASSSSLEMQWTRSYLVHCRTLVPGVQSAWCLDKPSLWKVWKELNHTITAFLTPHNRSHWAENGCSVYYNMSQRAKIMIINKLWGIFKILSLISSLFFSGRWNQEFSFKTLKNKTTPWGHLQRPQSAAVSRISTLNWAELPCFGQPVPQDM